mmetsp:Transcript_5686/g.4063  ORF Transcript_5686/g.4063 Transcript_5686/m.4063 type:complete len:100 (+) Transcript_5686:643-942(+)
MMPPRVEHCAVCNECILKVDHHSYIIGNKCIGLLNQKFFILFLLYTAIGSIYVTIMFLYDGEMTSWTQFKIMINDTVHRAIVMVASVFVAVLSSSVLSF